MREAPVAAATTEGGVDAARQLAVARSRVAVPVLRDAATGRLGDDPDLRSSACLALAKATDDPADGALLLAIARDDKLPTMVREGAALALGCLRRTEPAARFDGVFLDRLRGQLFEVLDDAKAPRRVRCFAALSLGVLGDQPCRDGEPFAKDGRATTHGLWVRLRDDDVDPELAVAMLQALSLQPPAGVPGAVRDGLRACAATGRVGRHDRGVTLQAHALVALARLSGAEASGVSLALARGARERPEVRRSAILALGPMAPSLPPASRAAAISDLLAHVRRSEPDTAGFAAIAVGRLVAASYADPTDPRRTTSAAVGALADIAERGNGSVRPFAALAIGLAFRSPPDASACPVAEKDRADALAVLRSIVEQDRGDPEVRAAAAVGLGLARDESVVAVLGRLAARNDADDTVRAYACAALGLMQVRTPSVLGALRAALARRSADAVRREAGRALGLLRDTESLPLLVAEIRADLPDTTRARAAVALGGLRDVRAVDPLVALVTDRKASELARAVAVAALGLVVDPERIRSLSRLGTDVNYLALTDALAEALSIL
ncbi:MAG: HEAT repeat domain-containing protein [Planctomycetes bacterium]|nr:HEAT repeat domain-containing protein [Planctomycetota bacterium]